MKKILAIAAILCMLLNTGAFAAEEDKLGEAIVNARKVLSVPEEYSEFNYSSYGEGEERLWELSWSGEKGHINAAVDETGRVISYYFYEDSDKSGLTDLTEEQAGTAAESFMKTVMPDEADSMSLKSSSAGYRFAFEYEQIINNIPERYNTCSIGVDKYSGKVTEFNRFMPSDTEYEFAERLISEPEAKEKYLAEIGIEMQYADYYDYNEKKLNIFPVYIVGGKNFAISAITGEKVDLSMASAEEARKMLSGGGAAMMANESAADMAYTPEEKAALEEISGFMSESAAAEKAAEALEFLPTAEFSQTGLYKNDRLGGIYYRNFRIKNDGEYIGSVTLEAETGRLMSFNVYPETENTAKISEEEAKALAVEFIKKHAGEEFAQTAEEENPLYVPLNAGKSGDMPSHYGFNYTREVNGIKYPSDRITVTYDNEKGIITSYNLSWNYSAEFPDISKAKTDEEIMEYADEILEFDLTYARGRLIYDFRNTAGIRLDAMTGKRINYDGSEYKENIRVAYTDIAGHWAEADILKLWNNNIYKSSPQFRPDEVITQSEFAEFIYGYKPSDSAVERLFGFMEEEKIQSDKPLTRADAARAIVGRLGLEKIAAHSEIFVYPFADEIAGDMKGYAAVCYALGIIRGDENGNFNPDKYVTNAQAAVMAVNVFDE